MANTGYDTKADPKDAIAQLKQSRGMEQKEEFEQDGLDESQAPKSQNKDVESHFFRGLFRQNVSFKAKNVQIDGKADSDINIDPIVLFPGAVLDLSGTPAVGRARKNTRFVEGHGGNLLLNPPGTNTMKQVKIETFNIGVENPNQNEASIMLQTAGGVQFKYEKATVTAQMLWMNRGKSANDEEQNMLHMAGVTVVYKKKDEENTEESPLGVLSSDRVEGKDGRDVKTHSDDLKIEELREEQAANAAREAAETKEKKKQAKSIAEQVAEAVKEKKRKEAEELERQKRKAEEIKKKEEERKATKEALAPLKDKIISELKDRDGLKEKFETVKETFEKIKPGKELKSDDEDDEEEGFKLTLAEVPIFPPFLWAEMTLEASVKPSFNVGFKAEADDLVNSYTENAKKKFDELMNNNDTLDDIGSLSSSGKSDHEDKKNGLDKKKDLIMSLLLPKRLIELPVSAEASIGLDASIEFRVSASAGIPKILTISAGLFANVGVHGTVNDDNVCFLAKGGATIGYDFEEAVLSLSNMSLDFQGGLGFYLGGGVDIVLESELFDYEHELAKYEKSAELLGISVQGALINPRTLSTKKGMKSNVSDLIHGWRLESASLRPSGLIADFVTKNPKNKGFNILTGNVFSAPLEEAETAINEAQVLIDKIENSGANINELELNGAFYGAIGALEESKLVLDELGEALEKKGGTYDNLEKLRNLMCRHEDIAKQLQDADIKHEIKGETKEDLAKTKDFLDEQDEKDAIEKVKTYDNIVKYEQERAAEKGTKHDNRIKELNEKILELNISNKMDDYNEQFAKFYQSKSNSEFSKDITSSSNYDDLMFYELDRTQKIRSKNKKRIDDLVKEIKKSGIAEPTVTYGISIPEWFVSRWKVPAGKGKEMEAVWEYYKKEMKGSKFMDQITKYMNRSQFIYEAEQKAIDAKSNVFDVEFKDEIPKLNGKNQNHFARFIDLQHISMIKDPGERESVYQKTLEDAQSIKLFEFYQTDPRFANDYKLVLMGKQGIDAYEQSVELSYMAKDIDKIFGGARANNLVPEVVDGKLTYRKPEKDELLMKAMFANTKNSVSLILAYEKIKLDYYIEKKDNDSIAKHRKAVATFQDLKRIANEASYTKKEIIVDDKNAVIDINQKIIDYFKERGGGFLDFLTERRGFELEEDQGKISILNDDLLKYVNGLEDIEEVKKHIARLQRISNTKDMHETWLNYDEDNATEYYNTLQKRALPKSVDPLNPTLDAWLSFEKLMVEKGDEKDWGAYNKKRKKELLDTKDSKIDSSIIRQLMTLYEGKNDEEAIKKYLEKTGGSIPKLNEERIKAIATPDKLLQFECDQANEVARKHIDRLQLILKPGKKTYPQIIHEYKKKVREESKSSKILSVLGIHSNSGFESYLKKHDAKFKRTPAEIISYETKRKEDVMEKHTSRLTRLEFSKKQEGEEKAVERYMVEAGRGFLRSQKKNIKEDIAKRKDSNPKGELSKEQRLAYHLAETEKYKKLYEEGEKPISEFKMKRQELAKILEKLNAIRNRKAAGGASS